MVEGETKGRGSLMESGGNVGQSEVAAANAGIWVTVGLENSEAEKKVLKF